MPIDQIVGNLRLLLGDNFQVTLQLPRGYRVQLVVKSQFAIVSLEKETEVDESKIFEGTYTKSKS